MAGAGLHEAALDESMAACKIETAPCGTGEEVHLQLESPSPSQAITATTTTAKIPHHEPSLMGLPAELRLIIYDFLTAGDHQKDLNVFPIGHFTLSAEHVSSDDPANPQDPSRRRDVAKSWSWLHTCRTMFREGRWKVLQTHIVSFKSEADFDSHDRKILKIIRCFHFSGFHAQSLAALVAVRTGRLITWRVVYNFDRSQLLDGRLRKPERSILVETQGRLKKLAGTFLTEAFGLRE